MKYDPSYASTAATAIPVIFVAIVVDLGLGKGSSSPRAALAVLSTVIVLLISELLCLNALSNQRELRTGESILVAGGMLASGVVIFFRVAGPLVKILRAHRLGGWVVGAGLVGFLVLWFLHGEHVLTGGTALVIFGMCVLFFGLIFPAMGSLAEMATGSNPYNHEQKAAAPAEPSNSEASSSEESES